MASAITDTPRVVIGLDFGTTFSGFAFAHRFDPDDVQVFIDWPNASRPYCKTQTSLFYSPNGELRGWGWEALEKHTQALQTFRTAWYKEHKVSPTQEDIHREVGYFATCFKLLLAGNQPKENAFTSLPANLSVGKLIVDYLSCISSFIMSHLRDKYGKNFSKREVQWCLTVPAIWTESSKRKMQIYAEKAELVCGKHCSSVEASVFPLRIILEPEAASFCCQKQLQRCNPLEKGDRFIVADIGGGTIDIVVHEKSEAAVGSKQSVREVVASSGDLGGGTFVDRNFFEFLKKKISCFEAFAHSEPKTVHDILTWWLGPRGKSTFDGSGSKLFSVPVKLSRAWKKHMTRLGGDSEDEEFYDEIEIREQDMKAIFDTEIQKAAELIRAQLTTDIRCILLVGGFSENAYLVCKMKRLFEDEVEDVLVPNNPGATICKGAVDIGFGQGVVLSRISKRWYGMGSSKRFCEWRDPPEYRFQRDDGLHYCSKIFSTFVRKNESVDYDQCVSKSYWPINWDQRRTTLSLISCSNDREPEYTTDPGCEKLAKYTLDISEDLQLGTSREVRVSMYFGRASIEVTAQRMNFGANREPETIYSDEFEASSGMV